MTANARKTTKSVIVPQEIKVETVTLEMSPQQAEALMLVRGRVGGCSDTSKRGLTQSLFAALRDAGVAWGRAPDLDGHLYFSAPGER